MKYKYILRNKFNNKIIERIITLNELEKGILIDVLKEYDVISRSRYTEVNDIEGREVYESDTVFVPEHFDGDIFVKNSKKTIVFEDGSFNIDSCDVYNYGIIIVPKDFKF